MPKHIYCAACGQELLATRIAVKKLNKIIDVVEPHNCLENVAELKEDEPKPEIVPISKDRPPNLNALFDSFKFVKNINNLSPKDPRQSDIDLDQAERLGTTDRRKETKDKSDIKTTAPTAILNQMKGMMNTSVNHKEIDNIEED